MTQFDADALLRRAAPKLPVDEAGLIRARARVDLCAASTARPIDKRIRRRGWWYLATAGVALAAGAVVLASWGAAPAFASWTPVPVVPPAEAAANATASCAQTAALTASPASAIVEQRGNVVMVLLSADQSSAICLWSTTSLGAVTGLAQEPIRPPIGEEIEISGQLDAWSKTDGDWTTIFGRVGPGVASLSVSRQYGDPVTATVGDGRFAAWWPGADPAVQVTIYRADGSLISVVQAR